MSPPVRILIVDDHALVRKGLRTLMQVEPGVEVAGEAADGEQAVEAARALAPDVILLDLVMPGKDGLAAIHEIMQEDPDARILVLTSFSDDERVFAAIKAGALGYLLKDCTPIELMEAIWAVYRGEISLSPIIALKLARELRQPVNLPLTPEPLTEKEAEVVRLVAQGFLTDEIAQKMDISARVLADYIRNILVKVHLANRAQAALYTRPEGP